MKKLLEFFESTRAVIIGGICLILSLILSFTVKNIPLYLEPAWVAVIFSGTPLALNAVRKLRFNKGISKISSALLITVAMVASTIIGDVFAAGEIAFIMAIGEILEDKTTAKARKGLKKLIALTPVTGRKIVDGKEETVPAEQIKEGDILRVLAGETIPVDGIIIWGETSVNQAVLTGEALPADKTVGDSLFCGTVNCFGTVDIKATDVGENSSLQKLITLVKEAEKKKAPMQRIADKWASCLVPVAFILAAIAGILRQDITVAVTMLVVFCPCALVLATPTAIMAAIGQATKNGVIIKTGKALEKMGKADTVAFDKTGTLTFGKMQVSDILPLKEGLDEKMLITLVSSAESKSEHPLGRAIVAAAKEKNLQSLPVDQFKMQTGMGIYAKIGQKEIYCGNEKYIIRQGIKTGEKEAKLLEKLRNQGKVTVVAAERGGVIGIIALTDTLKPQGRQTVERLLKMGVKSVLLTGDNAHTARYFAEKLGITKVKAELLPQNKVESIEELQMQGKTVCMVGDGVNDAPALKAADIGIAMGTMGSDMANETADIAVMGDDISKIPYLKRLSRATVNTIKLSISLSLLINIIAMVLSFFSLLNPTSGALVHNAGSVFVILIAALLYDRKFKI